MELYQGIYDLIDNFSCDLNWGILGCWQDTMNGVENGIIWKERRIDFDANEVE